jgi:hypothetical protein
VRNSVWGASLAALMVTVVLAAAQMPPPVRDGDVDLLAQRVLAMGGNGHPDADNMPEELNGWFHPPSPNYGLCGQRLDCALDAYDVVSWNAQVWRRDSDFDAQQADGVASLDRTLRATLAHTAPEDDVVVVGYSSSASVVVRYLRQLSAKAAAGEEVPDPDQVRFIAIGGPNRPNGGLFARFPGLRIPILGVTIDGANTETGYALTDISWKYDLVSDFPTYPLNLVALANAALGFFYLHSHYYEADPNNPDMVVSDPKWTGRAEGELTDYITIAPKHLPLLQPLYDNGFPTRLLDAIEPLLTEIVELGYDRRTPVWEATGARLLPPPEHFIEALPKITGAIRKGVDILVGREPGEDTPPRTTPARQRLEALKSDRAHRPDRDRVTLLRSRAAPERPRRFERPERRFAERASDRAERRAERRTLRQAEPAAA